MLREEEARKKWCPHVRVTTATRGEFGASNRMTAFDPSDPVVTDSNAYRCIASECMAWRSTKIEQRPTGREVVKTNGDRNFIVPETTTVVWGFCGLAGAP